MLIPEVINNSNSLIIKLMPNTSVLPAIPVPMLPKQELSTKNIYDIYHETLTSGRPLRKIIPKIFIDKCLL